MKKGNSSPSDIGVEKSITIITSKWVEVGRMLSLIGADEPLICYSVTSPPVAAIGCCLLLA